MDARVRPLNDILRLNTKLFRNCLDGLTDEQARGRPSAATNSATFIAAHLTDARFYLLRILGAEQSNPIAGALAGTRSIDDVKELPALAEIQKAWTIASRALRNRLPAMTAEELDAEVKSRFPIPEQTALAVLTFLVQHDSYHIGQLSLLRKHAGLPAMRYI